MKVEIIRGVYVDNKRMKAGDIVETPKGSLLMGIGAAIPFEEKEEKAAAPVNRAIKKTNKRG